MLIFVATEQKLHVSSGDPIARTTLAGTQHSLWLGPRNEVGEELHVSIVVGLEVVAIVLARASLCDGALFHHSPRHPSGGFAGFRQADHCHNESHAPARPTLQPSSLGWAKCQSVRDPSEAPDACRT